MKFQTARCILMPLMILCIGMIFVPESAFGCPTCKDSLQANQLSLGFAISIVFMMSMPFLILATWLTILFKSQCQQVMNRPPSSAAAKHQTQNARFQQSF